jgi:hypothetical protein
VPRNGAETVTLVDQEEAKLRLAEPHCFLQHDVEHRRKIAGRGVDDLQYLSGRGLLLSRISEFAPQRITFGRALVELLLEIGDDLLEIG